MTAGNSCYFAFMFLSAIRYPIGSPYIVMMLCHVNDATTLPLSLDRFPPNFPQTRVQVVARDTWFHIPEKFPLRCQICRKTLFLGYPICDQAMGHGKRSATPPLFPSPGGHPTDVPYLGDCTAVPHYNVVFLVIVGFFKMWPLDNIRHIFGRAAICITYRQVCCTVVLSFGTVDVESFGLTILDYVWQFCL